MKIEYEESKKWRFTENNKITEIQQGDIINFVVNTSCDFEKDTWLRINNVMSRKGYLTGQVHSLSTTKIKILLLDKDFYSCTYFELRAKNIDLISVK